MHRVTLSAVLMLLWCSAEAAQTSANALRQLYADYNAALMNKDGEKAAAILHSNIVAIYGEALQLAKTASRAQMQNVAAHQKLIALYLRAAASSQDIAAMNEARDVVAFMVDRGALRSDAQMSTDLRDFTFNGDEAVASLYASGRNTNLQLRFATEQGAWKIDLTDLNKMADDVYAQTAHLQKVSIEEALVRLVRAATGKPVADEVWIPLNAADAKRAGSN